MSAQVSHAVTAAILAGGRGRRLGGDKAMVQLGGRPLIAHVSAIIDAAGLPAVVVAKPRTVLPELGLAVLHEPEQPQHPLNGILCALRHFPTVLAVPCDMPFLSTGLLSALAATEAEAAVGCLDGRIQPLPLLVRATARTALERALADEAPVRTALAALALETLEIRRYGDPDRINLAVNTSADLDLAQKLLVPARVTERRGRERHSDQSD